MTIRPARPDEAAALHRLTIASKGSWGYPEHLLRALDDGLDVAAALGRPGLATVAERDGRVLGWAQVLAPQDGVSVLDHLWIDPRCMRSGVGTALFRHAAQAARSMGATTMEWEAEPNAAGFYTAMGGRATRRVISEWDRELDVMAVELD
jgi:GNAT superfamily N-acetyltransferase